MKLCECGCGRPTSVIPTTRPRLGLVKGEFRRFVKGHHNRNKGTKVKYSSLENKATHRLRAERALGKPLPPGAIVHHADGSRDENAPLVICPDQAYHRLLHIRMKVKAAGGNPNTDRVCTKCRLAKPFSAFGRSHCFNDGVLKTCKACHNARLRAIAAEKRAQRNRTISDAVDEMHL